MSFRPRAVRRDARPGKNCCQKKSPGGFWPPGLGIHSKRLNGYLAWRRRGRDRAARVLAHAADEGVAFERNGRAAQRAAVFACLPAEVVGPLRGHEELRFLSRTFGDGIRVRKAAEVREQTYLASRSCQEKSMQMFPAGRVSDG